MKKTKLLIIFFLIACAYVPAQNINGRFSSSVYMFERFDTVDVSNDYLRAYEMLSLNINKDKFSLRTYLNFEDDLSQDIVGDPRLRVYNLYFEGRNLLNLFSFKLGRQPLFTNVAGGLFDGANLDVKYSVFKLSGYYGGNVPDYQKFKFTDDLSNNYVLGGKISAEAANNLFVAIEYIKKNFKKQDYTAIRLDENLNPIETLIRANSNQYQFISADASYEQEKLFNADARFEYDLNFDEPSKFEFNGSYTQLKDLTLDFYYNYREPRIRYNSIFSVFDYGNTQEIEFGGSYKLNDIFTVSGRYGTVNYRDNENSGRITLGLNSSYGTLSYRKNLGYAGELDAVSLYTAYTFLEGLITPSVGLSYTDYKLSDADQKNNMTTFLAGINYRPWTELSFDAQGQYMNNKIYKNDYRLFLKVNYWFNTNLN